MNKFCKFILDLIFPIYCVNCKKEGEWICDVCKNKLIGPLEKFNNINIFVKKNINNLTFVDEIFYFYDFNNKIISNLIHILKYKYAYDAARCISDCVISNFVMFLRYLKNEYGKFIFVPVPLNKKRFNERGFNQSEIILRKLFTSVRSASVDKKIEFEIVDLLKRVRNTEHQASLSGEERNDNLKGAFILNDKININNYSGFNIVIFDDVVTTGNTIDKCAKVLKDNHFNGKIIGLTIAGQN